MKVELMRNSGKVALITLVVIGALVTLVVGCLAFSPFNKGEWRLQHPDDIKKTQECMDKEKHRILRPVLL